MPSLLSGEVYKIKLKNIINPFAQGDITGFIFESMKPDTMTVLEYYTDAGVTPSISIEAGQITGTSISAYPLNRNLYVDYTIIFYPMNSIPEGGSIIITFPQQYTLPLASICRIIRGLVDGSNPIVCASGGSTTFPSLSSRDVIIQKFALLEPQEIEIKIYATNPDTSGTTD